MPRTRQLDHVDVALYRNWEALQRTTSERQYAGDVARFLRDHPRVRIEAMDSTLVDFYRHQLPSRGGSRMTTSLSHFFQYALEQGRIQHNPIDRLKYRRGSKVSDLQLDFFVLLRSEGIAAKAIRRLVWGDFVAPAIESRNGAGLRVSGKVIALEPRVWEALLRRFRRLASVEDLRSLLHTKIAS